MRFSDRWVKVAAISTLCLLPRPDSASGLCRAAGKYVIEATVSTCSDVESPVKLKFALDRYSAKRNLRIAQRIVGEQDPGYVPPEDPVSRSIEVGDIDAEFKEFLSDNQGHLLYLFVHRSVGLLPQVDSDASGAYTLWKDLVGDLYPRDSYLYLVKPEGLGAAVEVTAFAASETGLCVSSQPVTKLLELVEPCCDLVPTGKAACLLDVWEAREISPETRKMLAKTEGWVGEATVEE